MTGAARRRYLSLAVEAAAARGARAVLADIGGHLCPGRRDLPLVSTSPDPALVPPSDLAVPELLGMVYEATVEPPQRRRGGVFYTPARLAATLATATLAGAEAGARVFDPAVGGGALLLAAARVLIARGAEPATVASQLGGVDVDALAVDVAVTALGVLLGTRPDSVRVGDGLAAPDGAWDAVIANPPFLGQLKRATARTRTDSAEIARRFGAAASGYADDAGLFLLAALEMLGEEGVIGFVLPTPLVATRDGEGIRRVVGAETSLVRLWSPPAADTLGFDAGVRVVLAVARKTAPTGSGADGGDGAWRRGEWALALADPGGPPRARLRSDGVIGDVAAATADFRDEYYAVAAATHDGAEGSPLVTCGLIDPARVRWGERSARIGRQAWARPRAHGLSGPAAEWAARRLVPKVMVATQTRVIEAAADEDGGWLPVVPVISVTSASCDVWALLAVLLAPAVSSYARRVHAGAALSHDAIKLSARQVTALPLPADRGAWADGADAARAATFAGRRGDGATWRAALGRLGDAMTDAYRVDDGAVRAWWWERIERLPEPGPLDATP